MKFGEKLQVARGNLKYIPLYEEWLYDGSRDLKTHHRIMGEIFDRPERVRTNTFSASGAGQCPRRRMLAYLGYKQERPNERAMGIFVNGDFVHLKHQIAGLTKGYFLAAEVSVRNDDYNLTGTMDADGSDGEIGEIKSINDYGFRGVCTYGPKHDHVEQVHSYMLCSGKNEARILYENKNTQELKEFLVKQNSATMSKVKTDLELLNRHLESKTLPPPKPECVEKTGECKSCPFREICLKAEFASPDSGRSIRVKLSRPNA